MLNIVMNAINTVLIYCQLLKGLPLITLKMLLKAVWDDLTISVACFPYSRDASSEYC